MYRWGIRSCMFSSSCFNFRFNLKYIQLNSTFRIIKAYQKSSDFVSQRSLSSSEQLYVYYFHILHFWGFVYYPKAWSNSKNNRNQHAFHLPFFIQAFCIKTCFSNKPVLLFNLPCVLLGSWNFNFLFFTGYEKKGVLVLVLIHAIAFLKSFVVLKLCIWTFSAADQSSRKATV